MEIKTYNPKQLESILEIKQLYSLHYFAYAKQFKYSGETHDFWELVYCDSGEACITDGESDYILSQGCAFLHRPNVYHNLRPHLTFANVAIFSFSGNLLPLEKIASKILPLNQLEKHSVKTLLSEGQKSINGRLDIVFQERPDFMDNPPYGAIQIIKNYLEILLISMVRKSDLPTETEKPQQNQNYRQSIASQIADILNANIGNPLRLSDIADILGYSPTYLKKIFKEQSGQPIIQYFIKIKIERAKHLMSESVFTVSQVSEMLGFDSLQYFSRQFRQVTNMSPSQYLKSLKIDEML